jgi:class 3 adenylate cyclase
LGGTSPADDAPVARRRAYGEPAVDPPKYVGVDVHRAAIMSAAHGGQVVISQSTHDLVPGEVSCAISGSTH